MTTLEAIGHTLPPLPTYHTVVDGHLTIAHVYLRTMSAYFNITYVYMIIANVYLIIKCANLTTIDLSMHFNKISSPEDIYFIILLF